MTALTQTVTPVVHQNGATPPRRNADLLPPLDRFAPRHLGPDAGDIAEMLAVVGVSSLDELIDQTVPR
ncbi:MAG TPA: hypothetical protein PKE45_04670, partial [Caldilineaceae bacterium]|nr:hypothetical protein [Caldilineaceae bacterium]